MYIKTKLKGDCFWIVFFCCLYRNCRYLNFFYFFKFDNYTTIFRACSCLLQTIKIKIYLVLHRSLFFFETLCFQSYIVVVITICRSLQHLIEGCFIQIVVTFLPCDFSIKLLEISRQIVFMEKEWYILPENHLVGYFISWLYLWHLP